MPLEKVWVLLERESPESSWQPVGASNSEEYVDRAKKALEEVVEDFREYSKACIPFLLD